MVTGGLGFVGAHVVKALVNGRDVEVTVLDDGSLGAVENLGEVAASVRTVTVDIRDRDATAAAVSAARPATVIHLAAIHFIPACDADPKRCVDVNVGGTQSVLEACAGAGTERVVLASTAAVYAPDETAHDESSTVGPTDVYGLTKLWTEQLGELHHARTSMPVRVARLFNVFGPGETNPHLIPAVIRQGERSATLRLGNLSTRRDYVYVGDVADGLIALADSDDDGVLTCNLGREQAIDGFELVAAIGEILERQFEVVTDRDRVRRSDRPLLLSDCSRAREVLGWRAETTLDAGLRAAVARPTAAGVEVD